MHSKRNLLCIHESNTGKSSLYTKSNITSSTTGRAGDAVDSVAQPSASAGDEKPCERRKPSQGESCTSPASWCWSTHLDCRRYSRTTVRTRADIMFVTLSNSHLRELPNVAGLSRHALLHLAQRLQVLNQGPLQQNRKPEKMWRASRRILRTFHQPTVGTKLRVTRSKRYPCTTTLRRRASTHRFHAQLPLQKECPRAPCAFFFQ